MAPTPKTRLLAVVDASVIVAYCANEADKIVTTTQALKRYSDGGWELFAPAVMFSETLYVLCRMAKEGDLTEPGYADAVRNLIDFLPVINPPPNGEAALVARAEQIRGNYGCSRAADSIYLALAEDLLAITAQVELLTFDSKWEKQAANNAPMLIGKIRTLAP